MEILEFDGREVILLDKTKDNCPICDTPLKDVRWTWNVFHGSAYSSCCHTDYQLKDYYIDNPNEEQQQHMDRLKETNTIEISVYEKYFEPIKKAMKDIGSDVVNDDVIDRMARGVDYL